MFSRTIIKRKASTSSSSSTCNNNNNSKLLQFKNHHFKFQLPYRILLPDYGGSLGHVNNCVLFHYFELVREKYFENLNLPVNRNLTIEDMNQSIERPFLYQVECRYRRQLVYPDDLILCAKVLDFVEVSHPSRKNKKLECMKMLHGVYSEKMNDFAAVGEGLIASYDYYEEKEYNDKIPYEWTKRVKDFEGY